jgi:H+/Cl- antiporter ClcA
MPPSRFGYYDRLLAHRYGLSFASYIAAAFVTGVACVAFMKAFSFAAAHRLDYHSMGYAAFILVPLIFSLAVWLVRKLAPYAAGSGIPQAIYIVRNGARLECSPIAAAMSSPQTLAVKTVSILLGVWAGASVGREGPTVQIAVCMMFLCMRLLSQFLPITLDPRSLALAGGAAGLAAAFNTPLAGVTFAIEELSGGYFENIKDYVLMAIIIAALSAKVLTGDYVYFGKLPDPPQLGAGALVIVSIVCGFAGHIFARGILAGARLCSGFANGKYGLYFPALCALAVLGLGFIGGPFVFGPGNGAAQACLDSNGAGVSAVFPAAKLAATVITYWSGVSGGIFAPSLSMGASLGADVARLLGYPLGSCALVGMSAFLCGAILAPMTSFVIIFELTGHHSMLLPVMLASLIAYVMLRSLGAKSLYPALADRYLVPAAARREKPRQPEHAINPT